MRLWSGLVVGLVVGGPADKIRLVESLSWSWSAVRATLRLNLVGGLVFGLVFGLIGGLFFGLLVGLTLALTFALGDGLSEGLSPTSRTPNEGIRRAAGHAAVNFLVFALAASLVEGLFFGLYGGLPDVPLLGPFAGVWFGLGFGGEACVQHVVLRAMLVRGGHTPRRYVRFLEYAAERVLLRRVGGAYEFIHPLLLDHFAGLQPGHLGERPPVSSTG